MNKNKQSDETGLSTILFIIFLILKLTHVIDWNWVWVISPLWIPCVIFLVFMMIFMTFTKPGTVWDRLLAFVVFSGALGLLTVVLLVVAGLIVPLMLIVIGLPLLIATIIIDVVWLKD